MKYEARPATKLLKLNLMFHYHVEFLLNSYTQNWSEAFSVIVSRVSFHSLNRRDLSIYCDAWKLLAWRSPEVNKTIKIEDLVRLVIHRTDNVSLSPSDVINSLIYDICRATPREPKEFPHASCKLFWTCSQLIELQIDCLMVSDDLLPKRQSCAVSAKISFDPLKLEL